MYIPSQSPFFMRMRQSDYESWVIRMCAVHWQWMRVKAHGNETVIHFNETGLGQIMKYGFSFWCYPNRCWLRVHVIYSVFSLSTDSVSFYLLFPLPLLLLPSRSLLSIISLPAQHMNVANSPYAKSRPFPAAEHLFTLIFNRASYNTRKQLASPPSLHFTSTQTQPLLMIICSTLYEIDKLFRQKLHATPL